MLSFIVNCSESVRGAVNQYLPSVVSNKTCAVFITAIAVVLGFTCKNNGSTHLKIAIHDEHSRQVLENEKSDLNSFVVRKYKMSSKVGRAKVLKTCEIWKKWVESNPDWIQSESPQKEDWTNIIYAIQDMCSDYKVKPSKSTKNPEYDTAIYVSENNSAIQSIALVSDRVDWLYIDQLATNPNNIVKTKGTIRGAGTAVVREALLDAGKPTRVVALKKSIPFYSKLGFKSLGIGSPGSLLMHADSTLKRNA